MIICLSLRQTEDINNDSNHEKANVLLAQHLWQPYHFNNNNNRYQTMVKTEMY